ncbi:MAG: polyprenol monophosphomannose synthase [Actinomycetota bacterium]
MRVLVLVPTYNESESVVKLLDRLAGVRETLTSDGHEVRVLVIDDNSPDGTAELVDGQGLDWVEVLRRPGKSGLGPSYIAGFGWGLERGFDLMVEMDADLSHQPEALPNLIAPVATDQADLTIGTRWMPGGKVINWPISRQLISRVGTGYARIALGLELRDVTSGYRVFHQRVLTSIDFDRIESQGYGFQIEMVLRTLEGGYRVKEVPITFVEREGGVSKMSKRIVIEALWKVTVWGLQRLIVRR